MGVLKPFKDVFGRSRYLETYHSKQPLVPRQRIEHFGHCWRSLCFRGVYDAFATKDETDAIFRKFEPLLRQDEARKPHGQGAYIGYTLLPRNEDATLMRVINRMSALLEREFGVRGAVPASMNLRSAQGAVSSHHRSDPPATVAHNFERQWMAQRAAHKGIATWHYDNAKKMDWLYTCLLYIGDEPDELLGGSTLFVDELSPCANGNGDCVSAGMMVAPTRSRLLCFSSGPENVHGGASAFGGYRVLLQIWWKCEGPEETGRTGKLEL